MEENIADFAAQLGCSALEQQYRQLAANRWVHGVPAAGFAWPSGVAGSVCCYKSGAVCSAYLVSGGATQPAALATGLQAGGAQYAVLEQRGLAGEAQQKQSPIFRFPAACRMPAVTNTSCSPSL